MDEGKKWYQERNIESWDGGFLICRMNEERIARRVFWPKMEEARGR